MAFLAQRPVHSWLKLDILFGCDCRLPRMIGLPASEINEASEPKI
jgi:hypothetical protein